MGAWAFCAGPTRSIARIGWPNVRGRIRPPRRRALGERLRDCFAPHLQWEEPYLTADLWGSGVWYSCLGVLEAFGGCVEVRESWGVLPDRRVGSRITPFGHDLLMAASVDPDGETVTPRTRSRPAESADDLVDVDVSVALFPWDRIDELRSRAAVHQAPRRPAPRHGEGLPVVVLYGNGGKMAPTIARIRVQGFAGIRLNRKGNGAELLITTHGTGPFPAFTFGEGSAVEAAQRFGSWTRTSKGAHGLVIFDSGIEARAPELIPAVFEAAAIPTVRPIDE